MALLALAPGVALARTDSPAFGDWKALAAFATLLGGVVTIIFNARQRLKIRKEEKEAMLLAFQSDIAALEKVITSMRPSFDKNVRDIPLPVWVDGPRGENYFQLFDKLVEKIGNLEPSVAKPVVSFYTHLKLSRDAAFPLGSLRKSWDRKFSSPADVSDKDWATLDPHLDNVKQALDGVVASATEALAEIRRAVRQSRQPCRWGRVWRARVRRSWRRRGWPRPR
ncbi:hypothetical protein [Pseudorhodoferax sp.]|uniref:hypothetical protein n=1 Tax=Pseudorhodoferax sp. TaxID=1993553 RepID=UPI002DD6621B|nr:hypothetical protein [Pseudorhodoferax sp.]